MKPMMGLLIMTLILVLGVGSLALAQSGGLTLPWHAINGGGGQSAGGGLTLTGALGSWSGNTSEGGPYTLRADLLGPRGRSSSPPPTPTPLPGSQYILFMPAVLRN